MTISCVNIIWTHFAIPGIPQGSRRGWGAGLPALDRGLGLGGPPPSRPSPLMTGLGCFCGPPAPSPPRGQTGPPRDRQTDTHSLGPADLTPAGPTSPRGQHRSKDPWLPAHIPVASSLMFVSPPQSLGHCVSPGPCLRASELVSLERLLSVDPIVLRLGLFLTLDVCAPVSVSVCWCHLVTFL